MKRIESILMTLVLLLCALAAALPAPALADGECGDGLTWSYDMSSNTLTISYSSHGWESGQMNNFDSAADQPWLDYREDAKTVVIAEEVTSIGEFAFCDFSNLTAVTFQGDSQLERICYGAFYGCASLPSISIPANVGLIDELAFKSCSQLAQINYRGTKAQWDEMSKNSGWNTGMGSSVSGGYKVCFVDGSGKVLGKLYQDGFWWEYNSTSSKLTVGHDGANGGAMPDYGKNSNKAPWRTDFEDSITSVVIESGVTGIGKHAFCDCYMITSVTIPETVINIKDSAFYGCESLTSVTIPASVTAFGSSAFCGCNELTSVTFLGAPDRFADHTFFDCEKLKHIDCDKATWLKLGNSNESLGSTPFESNPRFIDVSVSPAAGGTVTGGGAYANNTQVTLTATATQGYAFVNWTENGNVVKVNGQPAGAEYTFTPTADVTLKANFLQVSGNCGDNLTWALSDSDNNGSLDTLTISGTGAMYDYSYDNGGTLAPWRDSMGDIITVTVGEGATSVGNAAFYKCSGVANLSLPSTLESIGEFAFNGCTGLTAIDIPSKVTFIGMGAFDVCSNLQKVHISDLGAWCGITFGDYSANPLYYYGAGLYINNQPVKNLDVLPASVTQIKDYTFCSCSTLVSAAIPDGVTEIGGTAFTSCTSLENVTLPAGLSVSNIGDYTFNYCENLSHIYCTKAQGNAILNKKEDLLPYTPLYDNGRLIAAVPSPAGGGTVTGAGLHAKNTQVTLTAAPVSSGYVFVNWTDENGNVVLDANDKPIGAEYTFSVTADRTLTANFLELGSLKIRKLATVNGETTTGTKADGDYTFTVSKPGDNQPALHTVVITIENGALSAATLDGNTAQADGDGYVEVPGLVPGAYTVKETGSTNGSVTLTGSADGAQATVTAGQSGSNVAASGKVTFTNDWASATVTIASNGDITEGQDAAFTVSLSNPPKTEATITVRVGGTDYEVNIPAGESSGTLNIPTTDDAYLDPSSITATLYGITGGSYAETTCEGSATINIEDTIDDTTVALTADETGFQVKLSNPAGTDAMVTVTVGETAYEVAVAAGSDTGTLPFSSIPNAAGEATATVTAIEGGNFENFVTGATLTAAIPLVVLAPTFDSVGLGYEQPAAMPLTLQNTTDSAVTVSSVALSGTDADSFTLNKTDGATVAAKSTDTTTYTVQPKAGLGKKTYSAVITATYNNGKQTTATVSFTVGTGDIGYTAENVSAAYDGEAHGIAVQVSNPASGATVLFLDDQGNYTLTESPAITNVQAEPLTVGYQITADNYNTVTGAATVTITQAEVTVTAKDQTIKEGESIKTGVEQAELAGALTGHTLSAVTLTAKNGKIIASEAAIQDADKNNVTGNYAISYAQGDLTVLAKISQTVTFKVVGGGWNDETLTGDQAVTLTGWEGDTLKLASGDIPAVGGKPGTGYKAGGWDTAPSTETEITGNPTYTYTYLADTDELDQAITGAGTYYNGIKDGHATVASTLKGAIDTAQGVSDDQTSTAQQVSDALAALNDAMDAAKAGVVSDEISALPAADELKLTDSADVSAVRNDYDALTDDQKAKVSAETLQKLEDCELILAALQAAAEQDEKDAAAAKAVADMINALPAPEDVTKGDKNAIQTAQNAYDALTGDQKAKISAETLQKLADCGAALAALQAGCLITWLDENGEVVDTTFVEYGETPRHRDLPPYKKDGHTYVFVSWTPKITPADGDAAYRAVFGRYMPSAAGFVPGDANGDGVVDGRDLLRLARFLAGQDVEIVWQAAEMTGDGEVDGRDLLRLAKYVAGVI